MSAKKKKGTSPWCVCDRCNIVITQKDSLLHKEKSCPPNLSSWVHSFIFDYQLYSTVEIFHSDDKSLQLVPKKTRSDFALMPYHVLQLCKIPIGDPIIIKTAGSAPSTSFVKMAWPMQEKTSEFTIALMNEVAELNFLQPKSQVIACNIEGGVSPAEEVTITCENDISSFDMSILMTRIQRQNINKIYCIGNRVLIKLYGNRLIFKIVDITSLTTEREITNSFYLITNETKWKTDISKKEKPKSRNLLDKLGGLSSVISELKDIMSLVLNKKEVLSGIYITKGILIHGPMGTGKTTLMEALAEHFTSNIVRIECSKVFSKFLGETEKELQKCFEKAKQISPSVILIDDLDILSHNSNSSSSSEYEKRITASLSVLMDKLNNETNTPVVVLGTTSKLHQIDKMLRSPSRFGKEIEIHVPSSPQRLEILNVLLQDVDHNLSQTDIKSIADSSHGFVGADLVSLVSKAGLKNYKTSQGKDKISLDDFQWALSKVKPSAMKEIMIEVPNVKWTDIGGQDELKLKLKQSVEWPIKYSKSFKTLGITPPKGLLMFGPPGCSKTMIAKALATESQLNFISVKGPELFSKWVGESERAVRKVFRRARQTAPSIVFFDELDAIGGERNISSGSNVQERVLAQLLTELDGVEPLDNVTVIAATNRLDRIDPALLRPGRLDRIVYVPLPDLKTRKEIFSLQLQKTCVSQDVLIDELVEKSEGYSGAEIVAVCREAALKALEENLNAEVVSRKHFLDAFTIVIPRTPKSLLDMYENYLAK